MFDFQKLKVYTKSKELNRDILVLLSENNFDRHINDQLKRATFSILLNLAEGSSRFSRTLPSSPALTLVFFYRLYATSPFRIHAIQTSDPEAGQIIITMGKRARGKRNSWLL
jgi:hypothetical protein